jgi:predicted nucleic acid-binding Zn ribbon protein
MSTQLPNANLCAIAIAWPTIVDADTAAHSAPISFVGGTLTIATSSSAWSEQLQFLSTKILDGVTAHAPSITVKKLVFRAGAFRNEHAATK